MKNEKVSAIPLPKLSKKPNFYSMSIDLTVNRKKRISYIEDYAKDGGPGVV